MDINNDEDLRVAVIKSNSLIKNIHDYAGRDFTKNWKLQFPRGYVRTAEEQRVRIKFIPSDAFKDNLAYTLMLADTIHWFIARTDVSGTIQKQLIKMHLFILGSLVESITKVYLKGRCGKNYKFRTQFLCEAGEITRDLQADLDWVWDMRNNMHLFLIDGSEHVSENYTIANHNRAVRAFRSMLDSLNKSA